MKFISGIFIATFVGIILLNYEYNYLQPNSSNVTPLDYLKKKLQTNRSIYVTPVRKKQDKPLFQKTHYYMEYELKLEGNDTGFPNDTLIQITSKTGVIIKISAPPAFRLKTHDGKDATSWKGKESTQSAIMALFISGPGKSVFGTLSITILSVGKPITDKDIKVILDSKDSYKTLISYNENVKWKN